MRGGGRLNGCSGVGLGVGDGAGLDGTGGADRAGTVGAGREGPEGGGGGADLIEPPRLREGSGLGGLLNQG